MAQRVAAIFDRQGEAERAADALVDLGAERDQISLLARGEEGADQRQPSPHADKGDAMVEPAREVGDSGAALTTTDRGDVAQGATIGAVAGIAAGLLALMVPGIGLILAAGPLAMAAASGAIVGGVYGGLRDIGINEQHARGYEEHVRSGRVLLTGMLAHADEARVRAALEEHGGHEISFHEVATASTEGAVPAATTMRDQPAERRAITATDEIRVPIVEEELVVQKVQRATGEVVIRKETETRQAEQDVELRRERVEVDEEGDEVADRPVVAGPSRRA